MPVLRTCTRYFHWPAERAVATSWAYQVDAWGVEVYQCGHLLTEPRRRKDAAAPLQSLYVDLDHADIDHDFPPPTVVVASSPGRWQAYWRLTEPVPSAFGEALNQRLALVPGSDLSGWDLTQLLRVPGTHNHKYPNAPLVTLVAAEPVTYPVELLDAVLPGVAPASPSTDARLHQVGQVSKPAEGVPVPLSETAQAIWTGDRVKRAANGALDRSASLVRLAQVMADAGMEHDRIIAALWERDVSLGWRKYADRPNPARYCAAIAELVRRTR